MSGLKQSHVCYSASVAVACDGDQVRGEATGRKEQARRRQFLFDLLYRTSQMPHVPVFVLARRSLPAPQGHAGLRDETDIRSLYSTARCRAGLSSQDNGSDCKPRAGTAAWAPTGAALSSAPEGASAAGAAGHVKDARTRDET